jgi:hypothetical protein
MSEVGFLGKVWGRKTEKEAKNKTIPLGPKDSPIFASKFKQGKGSSSYLITKDPNEKNLSKDIAIAVQINQIITQTVVEYLKTKEINANLIIITNSEDIKSTKDLDDHDEEQWQAFVQDFKDIVTKIQAEVGNATFHLFFAAPATLTMALGVVFGKFLTVHIYNWTRGENSYTEVLKLPNTPIK